MPLLLGSVKQNYLNKKIFTPGSVGTAHGKGASPLSFCPPIVILSAAKNLFSRLKDRVQKILRRSAPQNDKGGKAAHQKDREEKRRSSE